MNLTTSSSSFNCRICNKLSFGNIFNVREMMFGTRKKYDYFQCSACHTLQIMRIPENMSPHYPANYLSFKIFGPFKIWAKGKHLQHTLFGGSGIGQLITYLKGPSSQAYFLKDIVAEKDGPILDMGCGQGELLRIMHRAGFRNLTGIDPFNITDLFIKNDFKIVRKNLSDLSGSFKVIMFHHSLEHVPNIAETLRHAYRLLSSSGKLIIRIPILAKPWEIYGVNWVQLDAPRHFHLMTATGLKAVAEKLGFHTSKVIYDSSELQFFGSEQYKENIPLNDSRSYGVNPKASIFSKNQMRQFIEEAKELNREEAGDSACFILKKSS